jgi:hypothetical protein
MAQPESQNRDFSKRLESIDCCQSAVRCDNESSASTPRYDCVELGLLGCASSLRLALSLGFALSRAKEGVAPLHYSHCHDSFDKQKHSISTVSTALPISTTLSISTKLSISTRTLKQVAMPQSPPVIPNRVSSWAALNDRQVNHRASKSDLKQKLSDKTLEEGSERHVKLRIESIELDQEELKIENEGLRLEKIEQAMDTKKYQKMRSKNYKRIVSLEDDLWCERRRLRKMREESGRVSLLTTDTDSAFAAALLRLYKDPETSRKRKSATQSAMRDESIKAYAAVPTSDDSTPAAYLRCSLTGEFDQPYRIHAAHIVPYCIGQELAAYLFGPDQSLRLNRPDNCLMMHEDIERAFDNGNITLFPVDPVSRPLLRWKIVLVNQDARNQPLKLDAAKTVGELDGRELTFRSEQRPASRFLYYHCVMSLLLCRSRDSHGWETVAPIWQDAGVAYSGPLSSGIDALGVGAVCRGYGRSGGGKAGQGPQLFERAVAGPR